VKCTFGGKRLCEKYSCLTNGGIPDWVKAEDLKIGDRTYTPTLHETHISADLNPNRMRLLGYYTAEGRVDKDQKKHLPSSIRFCLHEDELKTLAIEISWLMKQEFGIASHSLIRNKKRGDKGVIIAFNSFEWAPWFLKHAGIGSCTKKLSLGVVCAPIMWQQQFIGAWLNGDGCYDKLGWDKYGATGIRLTTHSDNLASQAMVILDRLGVFSRKQRIQASASVWKGQRIQSKKGWHVEIPASYVKRITETKWEVHGTSHNQLTTKGRYQYAASVISTLEKVSRRHFEGTVYNLSVQDDESYIVNRQAVHNCSIIASVDVYEPGTPTGSFLMDGFKGNRKFANYRVKPECDKFLNNNLDGWSRQTLLKAYPTFVGGHNFVEHVQMEDLSKGRIIDAVARDIGESVYVDILIATDRKHSDLIKAIENHKMSTLSMGCTIDFSQCTKCGHVGIDETELCPHIRYEKGNSFFDDQGRKHRVAELCGHSSVDPHGGVNFIEASWVGTPAFTGAVIRNILVPGADLAKKAQEILSSPPPQWSEDAHLKEASARQGVQVSKFSAPTVPGVRIGGIGDPRIIVGDADLFLAGWAEEVGGEAPGLDAPAPEEDVAPPAEEGGDEAPGEDTPPEKAPDADPFKTLEDDMVKTVKDRVQKRLQEELNPTPPRPTPEQSSIGTNSNIVKDARSLYLEGLETIVRTASTDVNLVDLVASYNGNHGIQIPVPIYRAALKVGSSSRYSSVEAFWGHVESR
jgi:hypothetical protein